VLIQVQDSGPGWKAEHADSIFDAFFTTKKNGIGMGLAISRSIIEGPRRAFVGHAQFAARCSLEFHHSNHRQCFMNHPGDVVFVVDDDASMRNALKSLLRSDGLKVELFESGQEFLQHKLPDVPSCLVLDVRLPGLSGLDVQRELTKAKISIPVVFITAHGDIPMSVRAMKAGAVEFLTKPFPTRSFSMRSSLRSSGTVKDVSRKAS
jgi:CheY-like chemotaxis protein